ncbi:uncharacterized protein LOC144649222 [Oculina patagonica]
MATASPTTTVTANLTRVLNEELSCPVCLEELKEPKCLPTCAHNVCKACLENMARSDPEIIRCPTCRRVSQVPPGGVSSLPTNNVLIKFLEITPGRQERLDIQKSLEKSKPVVQDMEKRLAILDHALENLQADWKKAKDDIHLTANIVVELIRNQESKLCEDVEDFYSKKQKSLQNQRQNMGSLMANSAACLETAEGVLVKGDVQELTEMSKVLTEQLREISLMNFEDADELKDRCGEQLEFFPNHDLQINLEKHCIGEVRRKISERKLPSLNTPRGSSDVDSIGRVIKKIGHKGTRKGNFKNPGGVASNAQGEIAVADYFNNRVEVFDEAGKFLFKFGKKGSDEGQFLGPTGITYTRTNKIIVMDSRNFRVQIFDKTGQFLMNFGKRGSNQGEFGWSEGVSVDENDNIIVTDTENNRVQIFLLDGTFVRQFGGRGPEGFDTPLGTVYHKEEFYTSDKGNNCIKVFDGNGVYVRQFGRVGAGTGDFRCPRGIAVDRLNDCILVCDSENNCVHVFNLDGTYVVNFATKKTPVGIDLLKGKKVVVSSYYGHCVQILSYRS